MKLEDMQINIRVFYKTGIFCFLGIGLLNSYSLFYNWSNILWSGRASAFLSVVFNFALVLFFNYLLQQLPKASEEEKLVAEKDLNELMESLK